MSVCFLLLSPARLTGMELVLLFISVALCNESLHLLLLTGLLHETKNNVCPQGECRNRTGLSKLV